MTDAKRFHAHGIINEVDGYINKLKVTKAVIEVVNRKERKKHGFGVKGATLTETIQHAQMSGTTVRKHVNELLQLDYLRDESAEDEDHYNLFPNRVKLEEILPGASP